MGRARPEIPVRPRPKKRFSSALPAVCTPRPARTLTQGQAAVCANRPHPRAQARQGCRKGRAARFCRRALARLHACVPGRSRCARAIRSRPMHTRGAAAGLACGSSGGLLTGHSCLRGIRRRLAMRGAAARAFAWRFCSYLDTRFCLSIRHTCRSARKHCEERYVFQSNLWITLLHAGAKKPPGTGRGGFCRGRAALQLWGTGSARVAASVGAMSSTAWPFSSRSTVRRPPCARRPKSSSSARALRMVS